MGILFYLNRLFLVFAHFGIDFAQPIAIFQASCYPCDVKKIQPGWGLVF